MGEVAAAQMSACGPVWTRGVDAREIGVTRTQAALGDTRSDAREGGVQAHDHKLTTADSSGTPMDVHPRLWCVQQRGDRAT